MKKFSFFGYIFIVAILILGLFSIFGMFYVDSNEEVYFSIGFLSIENSGITSSYAIEQIVFFVLIAGAGFLTLLRCISLRSETLAILSLLAPLLFITAILLNLFLVTVPGQEGNVIWDGSSILYRIDENAPLYMLIANLVLGAIFFFFSLVSTVYTFKHESAHLKSEVKEKNNFNASQQNVEVHQNQKMPENDPSFTSTPNDETFNIADKLQKLREDLANGVFDENALSESLTQEEINYLQNEDPTLSQELNINANNSAAIEPNNNINYNKNQEPVDPYKQTIVPRRAADKAVVYDKPIGNIASNKYGTGSQKERRNASYDPNYQGKVFLGDSDRIWEAMKKQNRKIIPKQAETDHLVSSSNIVNSLQKEKTQTMELDIKDIMDPINGREEDKITSTPTIDWDD